MTIDVTQSYRFKEFEHVLSAPIVNLSELRRLSWNGIPDKLRAETWQILLSYLPTNASRRDSTLKRKRQEYKLFARRSSLSDDTATTTHDQDIFRQVQADVPRTAPSVDLFRYKRIQFCLERLLFTWAMRNPASSYVQGMNDLATPLFVVFLGSYFDGKDMINEKDIDEISDDVLADVEADTYWCLTKTLAGIQDHYTPDQPGIQRMIFRLEELVNRLDYDLRSHFEKEGVEMKHFSFKWMNCLLVRELPLRCVIRMWDTYISEEGNHGFDDFHVYVCVAYLCRFSSQLKAMEFEELYGFWQTQPAASWSETDIELLLSKAFVWYSLFKGSQAHLTSMRLPLIQKPPREQTVAQDIILPISLMNDVDFLCDHDFFI